MWCSWRVTCNGCWLTPDEAEEKVASASFWLADYPIFWASLYGAIYPLTLPENWEVFGTETAENMASTFQAVLSDIQQTKAPED